ncbi:MAG: SH3 domain-containing protein [Hydrogenophilales bacterium]|nr:SH3 domain-containing protein [Hydrogenophilales bacterium]
MRVFSLIVLLVWALPALADTATVVEGTRVNLRSGKTDTYRVVKALEPGVEVEVLRQEQAYVQVKTSEGDVGWLPLRFVKIVPAPSKQPAPNSSIEELKAEIAKAQAELKQSRFSGDGASVWMFIGVGLGGLVLGILLGMVALQAYYRKKLNGLRI